MATAHRLCRVCYCKTVAHAPLGSTDEICPALPPVLRAQGGSSQPLFLPSCGFILCRSFTRIPPPRVWWRPVTPFVSVLRAAGRVSAYALLAQGYTPITFLGTSDSSTLAAGALLPKTVYRWTVSADLLRDELRHLHGVFVSPHIDGGSRQPCMLDPLAFAAAEAVR